MKKFNEKNLEIYHGIFIYQFSKCFVRRKMLPLLDDEILLHDVIKKGFNHKDKKLNPYLKEIFIPDRFIDYIKELIARWNLKFVYNPFLSIWKTDFTLGIYTTDNTKIYVIAVVHYKDQFNKKIGIKIIEGRIKRMLGDLEWEDEDHYLHASPYFIDKEGNIEFNWIFIES